MSAPATFLSDQHPVYGTTVVFHLGPGELLQLARFMEQMPEEGRKAVLAGGISVMAELPPTSLNQPGLMAPVKLKAGLAGGWTPEIIRVATQVMPLYYPEPEESGRG